MPTRNVNLTDHFDKFVAAEIDAGRFRNASEVMRAGLRLLEQQAREGEQKLRLLRAAAKKGFDELDQGLGIQLHGDQELRDFLSRLGSQARGQARRRADRPKRA